MRIKAPKSASKPIPKAAKDILELKRKQKNRCYWCYADISKRYDKDHYMPICKGGDSSLENFVLTCPSCNLSKNGLDPIVYANKNGRLLWDTRVGIGSAKARRYRGRS